MGFLRRVLKGIFGKAAVGVRLEKSPGAAEPLPAIAPHTAFVPPPQSASEEVDKIRVPVVVPPSAIPTSPTLASSPPPVLRRQGGPRAITIGLDFGTHSTKILLRPRGLDKARLLTITKPHEGYPSFACPSLVKVADDKVYFGSRALEIAGGTLYRSLKVQLLPAEGDESGMEPFPRGLTPDLLVAWYLSWVLGRIRRAVEKYFPHSNPKLSCNLAAPMNHIENESLKTRYLGIVHAAWRSVFGPELLPTEQGMSVSELRARFVRLLAKEVPGRELRPFEILPETVAPIVSLSLDPRMTPGMYLIGDMGAGTTELSVSHVQEPGADQHVLCYFDQSVRIGGDNFEWAERDGTLTCSRNDLVAKLVRRFMKAFRQTWGAGYHKDSRNPASRGKWRNLHVLLTGGGARRREIEREIDGALPMQPWPVGEERYSVSWHEPMGIDMVAVADPPSTSFLSVAHGLSIPRQQWPDFFVPGEIEVQEALEVIEQPPPYWYVD